MGVNSYTNRYLCKNIGLTIKMLFSANHVTDKRLMINEDSSDEMPRAIF